MLTLLSGSANSNQEEELHNETFSLKIQHLKILKINHFLLIRFLRNKTATI